MVALLALPSAQALSLKYPLPEGLVDDALSDADIKAAAEGDDSNAKLLKAYLTNGTEYEGQSVCKARYAGFFAE